MLRVKQTSVGCSKHLAITYFSMRKCVPNCNETLGKSMFLKHELLVQWNKKRIFSTQLLVAGLNTLDDSSY